MPKLAAMWCTYIDNENLYLISPKLVTEVLDMTIKRNQETSIVRMGHKVYKIQGYVDLEWSLLEQKPEKRSTLVKHTDRFMVLQNDPPFDIAVGGRIYRNSG